ncbi:MAG: amino acid permease [Planctomycetes bacterium]|nr:amino acid permease [Planctomycetota bacterium]
MSDSRAPSYGRFGTFGGVFTPCTLTILGVIMFLRFGQVVGNAGLWWTIGIVLLAKAITTITAFSVSAIATNTELRGGGAYYMISRSLGVEFGGSIGLVFFLAQAVSVALYVIGFTEALVASMPGLEGYSILVASGVNALVCLCVFIGAGWTIRLQYGILAVLTLAVLSFVVGGVMRFDVELLQSNLAPDYAPGQSKFTMFALFFPAATGIMAGANLSGDLKDPARSIPRGTLASIGVTGLVYIGMGVLLAGVEERTFLQSSNMAVRDAAAAPALITLGIFAATLSSAIGSMMGAPRILQALGRDGIFKSTLWFSKGAGDNQEPQRAIVLTGVIAQVSILVGTLDLIAPIITMFFMVTYGYLNFATFRESYSRNPSYRPTFRYAHWSLALLGGVACAAVMLLIAPMWALVAAAMMFGLHQLISRRKIRTSWGNVRSGAAYERARKELRRLEDEHYHPKNWRPSILAFSGTVTGRKRAAIFGNWLCSGRGILSLGQVIPGDVEDLVERRRGQEKALRKFIQKERLDAFPAVVVSNDRQRGVEALVQCHGLGGLRPNSVMGDWIRNREEAEDYVHALRRVSMLGQSLLLLSCRVDPEADPHEVPTGTVDVWWRGKKNGALMVLLAHMLVQNADWRGRHVRLLRVVDNEAALEETERHLAELVQRSRIEARVQVVVSDSAVHAIHEVSRHAAVVFLGFEVPGEDSGAEAFVDANDTLVGGLETVVLVNSVGDASLEV